MKVWSELGRSSLQAGRPFIVRASMLAILAVLGGASAEAQVVISQVYGGNGSVYNQDYVELFNRGATPVSLAGRSIQYSSATGTGLFSANGISVLSGTLNPGQFVLVGLATAATGAALPAPFAAGSAATNLSATNGKVVLVDSTSGLACNGGSTPCSPAQQALILDLVGYGSANFFEGSAAPVASSTTALFRAGAGCIDTNVNGADFTTGAPAPRTSASPLQPCTTGTSVELSVDVSTGSEAAGTTVTATVTASAAVVGDQSVLLNVAGTGITPADYLLSSGVVTLLDGTTTGTALFTIVDDVEVEGTEVATLSISGPSAGIALGAVTSRAVSIADDDGCGVGGVTKIHDVQGSGATTPLTGTNVTVEAIVVGRYQGTPTDSLQGFFLQEEDADADANPATSEGLFVFEGSSGLAAGIDVGDRVRVTGTATEFFGLTELSSLTNAQICATDQPVPTAAVVTLPVPGVPNGDLALATAAIDAYFEPFENMRVTVPATLSVAEYFELERYGQIVLSQGGRIPTFTAANPPSTTGWIDHQIDVARRTVLFDDQDNRQNSALTNNRPLPHPQPGLSTTNRFRGGDEISGLTGVLSWTFAGLTGTDAWRIRPVNETETYVYTSSNPRPIAPPSVGGTLRIATFNVLNYFATIDTTASNSTGPCGPSGTLDCRGADSAAELVRQTSKLVAALCGMGPDVAALMEIENDAFAAASALVSAANAVPGCGPYSFVNTSSIGGDAIKVGLLYDTTTVAPVGVHQVLDTSVDPRFIDTKNRPVLAQTFVETATGEKWTAAVVHLKSKGSACDDVGDPDANDGQGNCNGTRTAAAEALVDWLATDPTASGDPDFLILGDMNSYAKEDPIRAVLEGADDVAGNGDDYVDVVTAFGGPAAYGYVFDGQVGRLDHALASASLAPKLTGAAPWHINADEPPAFDYNDTVLDAGEASFEARPAALPLYAPDAFRSSDHDPILIGLPEPGLGALVAGGAIGLAWIGRRKRE